MDHVGVEELRKMVIAAKSKVFVGSKYTHYKDQAKLYVVTGISILEATDEIAVRYAMVNNPDIEFVRALGSWLDTVVWNGQSVPRFTKV